MSYPQAIPPAPEPSNNALEPLRSMNPHGLIYQHIQGGIDFSYGKQGLAHEQVSTHVAATGPGGGKHTQIPAKNTHGKFPCPHCVKTYLHAKHLKRHLLRHTGDRPY
ncbi:hypothetical protein VE03_10488, partial [Pseudogymnoascus sp. 23342-1-I1]